LHFPGNGLLDRVCNTKAGLRRKLRAVCRLGGLGFLVSCAGIDRTDPLPENFVLGNEVGFGVITGSVGSRPDQWHEWSQYYFRATDGGRTSGYLNSGATYNPFYLFGDMPRCEDDGLAAECGHLYAIVLPVGDYEIHQVAPAMDSYIAGTAGVGVWSEPLRGYRFRVSPGRVTYLGNLLSRVCTAGAVVGSRVWSAIGDVADLSARDIPLLRTKYPQLADSTFDIAVMPGEPWRWRYQPNNWFNLNEEPPAGWPADCSLEPGTLSSYLRGDK